ncbi:MAG: hypothetical protein D3908_11815 [Candidatus Electrothrix sp. AUS4]|nr:hypothetical protein [Candidatus Electrothrix sp. AUS4]
MTFWMKQENEKMESIYYQFLHGSPADGYARTAQLSLEYRYSLPLDLFVITDNIEEDTLYLFFGGPSGGGPSGSAHLEFVNECGVKEDFIPLLGDDSIPFTIQFVEGERAMEYPLGVRIIMTPFTVAFDIVTFPVQALLVVTLGRIGY